MIIIPVVVMVVIMMVGNMNIRRTFLRMHRNKDITSKTSRLLTVHMINIATYLVIDMIMEAPQYII